MPEEKVLSVALQLPTAQQATDILPVLSNWKPYPTLVKLLLERARDRLATEKEIASRAGVSANYLADLKHKEPFRTLYQGATYDERIAVLLLAYYTLRGAYKTLYDALVGDTRPLRAQIMAAQAVIEQAERRARVGSGPNPLDKLLTIESVNGDIESDSDILTNK